MLCGSYVPIKFSDAVLVHRTATRHRSYKDLSVRESVSFSFTYSVSIRYLVTTIALCADEGTFVSHTLCSNTKQLPDIEAFRTSMCARESESRSRAIVAHLSNISLTWSTCMSERALSFLIRLL